jgi:hypothetical protein
MNKPSPHGWVKANTANAIKIPVTRPSTITPKTDNRRGPSGKRKKRGADLVAFADIAALTPDFAFIVAVLPNPEINRHPQAPIAILTRPHWHQARRTERRNITPQSAVLALASVAMVQRFGRYCATIRHRSLLTHFDISRLAIAALRKEFHHWQLMSSFGR